MTTPAATDFRPAPTADAIPPEWIAERRVILARDGHALRPAADAPAIEVQSLTLDRWLRLTLPHGATTFATPADRDTVFAALTS